MNSKQQAVFDKYRKDCRRKGLDVEIIDKASIWDERPPKPDFAINWWAKGDVNVRKAEKMIRQLRYAIKTVKQLNRLGKVNKMENKKSQNELDLESWGLPKMGAGELKELESLIRKRRKELREVEA